MVLVCLLGGHYTAVSSGKLRIKSILCLYRIFPGDFYFSNDAIRKDLLSTVPFSIMGRFYRMDDGLFHSCTFRYFSFLGTIQKKIREFHFSIVQ